MICCEFSALTSVAEKVRTYSIPQPVASRAQSNASRADGQREDFSNDNPRAGTPSRGKEEDEDGDKGNLRIDGRDIVRQASVRVAWVWVSVVEADCNTDNGDQELTDEHAKGAPDEQWSTAELLNGPERERRAADVDQGEDERNQKGIVDGTRGLEERGRIVEDEVDTGPGYESVSARICNAGRLLTIAASFARKCPGWSCADSIFAPTSFP
jgi:hypothetical protein